MKKLVATVAVLGGILAASLLGAPAASAYTVSQCHPVNTGRGSVCWVDYNWWEEWFEGQHDHWQWYYIS